MLVELYASRVILRVLGFDDYGIFNVVGSVILLFNFLKTALTNATSRYIAYELGKNDKIGLKRVFSMSINCHLLLSVCILMILETAGVWFINHRLNILPERIGATNWLFQFSLLSFCIGTASVPFTSAILAHERMNVYSYISITEALLKLGTALVIVYSPFDHLATYGGLLFIVSIIVLLYNLLYCHWSLKDCKYIKYWNWCTARELMKYSGWSVLVSAADGVTNQSRSIFFNWFLGTVANAALGIANQVIALMNVFVANFSKSFYPQLIKSYAAGNNVYFMKMIYSYSKVCHFLLLCISIPIVANLDFILSLWLGNYPPQTGAFIKAIVVFTFFDAFQQPLWYAVYATGDLKNHQILIGSIKVMAIPITYITLRLGYSPEMALYLWAALNAICAIARTIYLKYFINLSLRKYCFDVVLRIIIVSLLVVLPVFLLTWVVEDELFKLFVTTITSTVCLGLFGYFFGLNREERLVVRRIVKRKTHT